jgi:hypothetical protein
MFWNGMKGKNPTPDLTFAAALDYAPSPETFPVTLKKRYEALHRRQVRRAEDGQILRLGQSRDGQAARPHRRGGQGRPRCGGEKRAPRLRKDVGSDESVGARQIPLPHRAASPGKGA